MGLLYYLKAPYGHMLKGPRGGFSGGAEFVNCLSQRKDIGEVEHRNMRYKLNRNKGPVFIF